MRSAIFPQAQALYATVAAELAAAQQQAAGFPWWSVILTLILLVALVAMQVLLSARTRRTFNIGLLAASLATALGLVVLLVASLGAIGGALTSRTDGTAQRQVLAVAEVEALQARAVRRCGLCPFGKAETVGGQRCRRAT